MTQFNGNIDSFGMDTISLAGPLEGKLKAMREAGFTQVMLSARDIVGHEQGVEAAIRVVKDSGLRVTGFQVLRDFEGLSGGLREYKVDIAKAMLELCSAVGSKVLLVCSSTSTHATDDMDVIATDLRRLAMLALPRGIKVAFEGLSWGRTINEFPQAWDAVCRADMPNLGLGVDDDVHVALAVKQHFARAVARHGVEAQGLQHLAQGLRLGGQVLDELDAFHAQGVVGGLQAFALGGVNLHGVLSGKFRRSVGCAQAFLARATRPSMARR